MSFRINAALLAQHMATYKAAFIMYITGGGGGEEAGEFLGDVKILKRNKARGDLEIYKNIKGGGCIFYVDLF